ncbi:MAG: hypothetical protein J6R86_03470 [Lentisphaeria bacterium]|nr:hypothetical protein [Lentisphaeria bacterium]
MPIANNKTSRVGSRRKHRSQAVISRDSGVLTKTTSRMSGEQPDDMRNSQRRYSATHAVSSRRDDRAMMTKKERGDVNSRSRASPLF